MMPPMSTQFVGMLLVLAACAEAQTAPAPSVPAPLNVCFSPISPMVECVPGSSVDTFTGFEYNIFEKVADDMQWTEGVDYVAKCVDNDILRASLPAGNGTCSIALGGITITADRQNEIEFAFPHWSAGLGIMVRTSVTQSNGWGWLSPFSPLLWMAVLLTVVIFPLFVFFIEWGSLKRNINPVDIVPGVHNAMNSSVWTLLGLETLEVGSWGAKVASLSFAFMSLILINTYTANLAANLTIKSISSNIRVIGDLRGKVVVTSPVYADRLRLQYGLVLTPLPFNGLPTLKEMTGQLLSGAIAAFVYDAPILKGYLLNRSTCDIGLLPTTVLEPFSYGIAFEKGFNQTIIENISNSILEIQNEGVIEEFKANFFPDNDVAGCQIEETTGASLKTIWGLWIVLAAGICVGLAGMLVNRRMRTKRDKNWKSVRSPLEDDKEEIEGEEEGHLSLNPFKSKARKDLNGIGSKTTGIDPKTNDYAKV